MLRNDFDFHNVSDTTPVCPESGRRSTRTSSDSILLSMEIVPFMHSTAAAR